MERRHPLDYFFQLFLDLDATSKTSDKQRALVRYFEHAPDSDALWAIALFTGRRPKRPMTTTKLREWAAEFSGIPLWFFEETYHIVGDLAETIAKILPAKLSASTRNPTPQPQSLEALVQTIIALHGAPESVQKETLYRLWNHFDENQRFVLNKVLTGGMRIGVSNKSMVRALAAYLNEDPAHIAHRLMGQWSPASTTFEQLLRAPSILDDRSKPYPFCLAHPFTPSATPEPNLDLSTYQIEYKWDGIRGQAITREGSAFLWSRGEELITDTFPELIEKLQKLPFSAVMDGEILAYKDGEPLSFQLLQTRIGRKKPSKALLHNAPVTFLIYDVLEFQGVDVRAHTQAARRKILVTHRAAIESAGFLISEVLEVGEYSELSALRANSRSLGAEGLMLKHKHMPYATGRVTGHWYKWKTEPLTIDAVLLYAMRGHGRRSNRYTDYTFAVWKGDELVPFTKAYSGLTDAEIDRVDAFVKKHTLDRFGPVRSVKPELVFEVGFEGISASKRHKSGVSVRFPRILRWRTDKPVKEANTLDDLYNLLKQYE